MRRQVTADDLARRLHAVAIRLLRRARRDDAAMGLPPGQASALSVLVFGGAKTLSQLAAIEQVRAPTMSRMVDALERGGLVRRSASAADRRSVDVGATAAGVRLMHRGRDRRVSVLTEALASLGREQRSVIEAAIDVLERLPPASRG